MDFEASTWFAFFFPKGTPDAIVKKLHDATVAALDTPALQEQLVTTGTFVVPPEHRATAYLQSIIGPEIDKNRARPACRSSERAHGRQKTRRPARPALHRSEQPVLQRGAARTRHRRALQGRRENQCRRILRQRGLDQGRGRQSQGPDRKSTRL